MLKFLLAKFQRTVSIRRMSDGAICPQWLRDPLSHPALEAMSERELADLPFRR